MDKIAKMALLADFYGPLLTEKQQNVWDLHYQQDLSLAEIAEAEHISRQAIYDLLKRTERILAEYEEKLGLVQRFWTERLKLAQVQALLQEFDEQDFASDPARERYQKVSAMIEDLFLNI
ncbi:MAG: putative DNA-binding protein [Bacillota bacterium]|nr:putative DNA-binding protein [Bacillota bacterium]MDP4158646.1 putative DNA-binding protein [Bacillota bacterium]